MKISSIALVAVLSSMSHIIASPRSQLQRPGSSSASLDDSVYAPESVQNDGTLYGVDSTFTDSVAGEEQTGAVISDSEPATASEQENYSILVDQQQEHGHEEEVEQQLSEQISGSGPVWDEAESIAGVSNDGDLQIIDDSSNPIYHVPATSIEAAVLTQDETTSVDSFAVQQLEEEPETDGAGEGGDGEGTARFGQKAALLEEMAAASSSASASSAPGSGHALLLALFMSIHLLAI